jgi:two-component system phosphate regulon response regulator PhoB
MSDGRVLIVEDDSNLVEMLTWHFEREGFQVRATSDAEEALRIARADPPDLMLLDWMLPGFSGIEVCQSMKRSSSTQAVAIIMLTAKSEERDRISGLEAGADDFVAKPFSPRELIARARAVLRRVKPSVGGTTLAYADLWMDVDNFRVKRDGKTLSLGPREFHLLRHFMENPRRVFSRERLLTAVWGGGADVGARTVDVHIRRLRTTLNHGGAPDLIRTVRSGGYALDHEG